ncbi:hypothetical protein NPIL_564921 [Nephila pilipes]|uniref:Uncharacterized protein n=1 Tax=Nephila pilipes TaxID=299642 RepID=A0A8X6P1W6_NEPPI|nr:hypothetical protein NPIL_564921 [Nephila pilipes]
MSESKRRTFRSGRKEKKKKKISVLMTSLNDVIYRVACRSRFQSSGANSWEPLPTTANEPVSNNRLDCVDAASPPDVAGVALGHPSSPRKPNHHPMEDGKAIHPNKHWKTQFCTFVIVPITISKDIYLGKIEKSDQLFNLSTSMII